jgi:membrane fusion protein, multidrug efflux system
VRAGQPIARIDDRVLRAQHDQAVSEAALALETYERQRRLWEEDGIGSEMNYLRAKYGAETADGERTDAGARVWTAPSSARRSTACSRQRLVEVGSMVAPGTPVARIIDIDTLKVTGGVPERYAAEIRTGAAATSCSTTWRAGSSRAHAVRGLGRERAEPHVPDRGAVPNTGAC